MDLGSPCVFDESKFLEYPIDYVSLNLSARLREVAIMSDRNGRDRKGKVASLLRAVSCMDLTTLCGDDTICSIERLCYKAENPIQEDILKQLEINPEKIHVAAVCVYPSRVADCVDILKGFKSKVPVAAVAAGFPSGQYHLDSKLEEIKDCIKDGAKEIDIVISRDLVLGGEWDMLNDEVKSFKEVCGPDVLLKTIIAAGELGSFESIYRASVICMNAGADFVKTSTGKESVNATLPIGLAMIDAIDDFFYERGLKIGFKPAGGIRTVKDVFLWQDLMDFELGTEWLSPSLFRIGASSLLCDIEKNLFQLVNGYPASKNAFPYP